MIKRSVLTLGHFLLTLGVLSVVYGIWNQLEWMPDQRLAVVASYLIWSAITSVVCLLSGYAIFPFIKQVLPKHQFTLRALVTFVLLAAVAIYLGPFAGWIPQVVENMTYGNFFSGLSFLSFILFAAPILSVFTAMYFKFKDESLNLK